MCALALMLSGVCAAGPESLCGEMARKVCAPSFLRAQKRRHTRRRRARLPGLADAPGQACAVSLDLMPLVLRQDVFMLHPFPLPSASSWACRTQKQLLRNGYVLTAATSSTATASTLARGTPEAPRPSTRPPSYRGRLQGGHADRWARHPSPPTTNAMLLKTGVGDFSTWCSRMSLRSVHESY